MTPCISDYTATQITTTSGLDRTHLQKGLDQAPEKITKLFWRHVSFDERTITIVSMSSETARERTILKMTVSRQVRHCGNQFARVNRFGHMRLEARR
jgi:hypothetical protein